MNVIFKVIFLCVFSIKVLHKNYSVNKSKSFEQAYRGNSGPRTLRDFFLVLWLAKSQRNQS